MDSWWVVNSARDFLAFCRGKSPYAYALCYAHKEARDHVLRFLDTCLRTGVDGVDLRLSSHNSTFEPMAYGFNEPVVAEFRRRFGVDPLTEDFDWFEWQALHGEYLTQLMREASAFLRERGKKCQVHLGHYVAADKRQYGVLNLYHDWKTWLREGLVDGVSFQDETVDSPHWHEVRELTDEMGIPFYYRRRHSAQRPGETWTDLEARLSREASDFGMDGMILYENFSAIRQGERPGTIEVIAPGIAEVIRRIKRP